MSKTRFKEDISKRYKIVKEYFKKFQSMADKKNKKVLVIDIGSHSIKGVVGKYESGKIDILNNFIVSNTPSVYMDGKINNLLEIKESLKKALHKNEICEKVTICTIESSFIISREISLPLINKNDLEDMIYYEIAQYMPIELEKYIVQYKILENFLEGEVEKIRILAVALPEEIASGILELLEFLDLTPMALDLHSNGINKLIDSNFYINSMKDELKNTVAVLDLGYSHINVVIIENGIHKFSRIIDLSDRASNIMSNKSYNINPETLKIDDYTMNTINGPYDSLATTLDLNEEDIYESLAQIDQHAMQLNIDSWIDQINQIFKYYTSRHSTNIINNIFIYGGRSNLVGLEEYMTSGFQIPTFKINHIDNVEFKNNELNEVGIGDYINAIAALIRK